MKTPLRHGQMRPLGPVLALVAAGLLLAACGQIRTVPATFEAQEYKPIAYEALLDPGKAGLQAGDKVKMEAFFWQFLEYDPDMVKNYFLLARRPVGWLKLKWFGLYGSEDMRGYFDLAAMDGKQEEKFKPKRLTPYMIYGELVPLGKGVLYLRLHNMQKIEKD